MIDQQLRTKPLVEALLEVKWSLEETSRGTKRDPAYPLFVGRLYEQVKDSYGYVQKLDATQVPDEITPYIVKYRFRVTEDGWPLVQAGPGIASLNFTDSYKWDKFLAAANNFIPKLIEAYAPSPAGEQEAPTFSSVMLRYINAVEVDFEREDIVDYISKNLHTRVVLPKKIAQSPVVSGSPEKFEINIANPLNDPPGLGSLRLAKGTYSGRSAIIWELIVRSTDADTPQNPESFEEWLRKAHDVAESWFNTLIEGNLEKQFGRI